MSHCGGARALSVSASLCECRFLDIESARGRRRVFRQVLSARMWLFLVLVFEE